MATKNIQLKDGQGNLLMPISGTNSLIGLNNFASVVEDNEEEGGIVFDLETLNITVTGVLKDSKNNVISGGKLKIGEWSTVTSSDGSFEMQVPIGKWVLDCQNFQTTEIVVSTANLGVIILTELPTRSVTIHLVGSTYGDAMPNTVITCDSGESATTNEFGAATFSSIHEGVHTFTVNENDKVGTRTFMVWNSQSMSKKCMECTGDDIYEDTDVILSANEEDADLECYNVPLYNALTTAITALANEDHRIILAAAKAASAAISFYNNTNITDATQLKFFTNIRFTAANALRGMTNLNKIVLTGQFGSGASNCIALFFNNGTVAYFSLWKAKVYGGYYSSGADWIGATTITHFVTNPNMPYLKYGQKWGGLVDMDDLHTSTSLISLQRFYQDFTPPATTRIKAFNTENVTTFNGFILKGQSLVNLYIDGTFNCTKATSFADWLGGSGNLSGYRPTNLQNIYGKLSDVNVNISFQYCAKLTKSTIENILTWLRVYEAGSNTRTITFHATAKATYGATQLAEDLNAIGWALA